MRARAASFGVVAFVGVLATSSLVGCNDDGRTLRPARPDQVGSVSTLAPVTTVALDPLETGEFGVTVAPTPAQTNAPTPLVPTPAVLTAPFTEGSAIDSRYTCEGIDVSPALSWTPAPEGTVEIAVSMIDLDLGPTPFAHWAMAGIDPLSTALGEGVVPEFAIVGINGADQPGYTGPCPPAGSTHRYLFTVHFLNRQTELPDGSPAADLQASVNTSTFASASVTGTYSQR